jgi:hypothetical protein
MNGVDILVVSHGPKLGVNHRSSSDLESTLVVQQSPPVAARYSSYLVMSTFIFLTTVMIPR